MIDGIENSDCPNCNAGSFNNKHCFDCGSKFNSIYDKQKSALKALNELYELRVITAYLYQHLNLRITNKYK